MSNFSELMLEKGMKYKNGYIFFKDRFEFQGNIFMFDDIVTVEVNYHDFKEKIDNNQITKCKPLVYNLFVKNNKTISRHNFIFTPHSLCVKLFLSKSIELRSKKFIEQINNYDFFEYDKYRIYKNCKILYKDKLYNLLDLKFKNGVYILESGCIFSRDTYLEINNDYDVVLELLRIFINDHNLSVKKNSVELYGGGEMGLLWKLVKGAAISALDLKAIQSGSDKVLLDAGFNILSINKQIRKAADLEVKNYFMNQADGPSITIYEAAMLKICLIYEVAEEVDDVGMKYSIIDTQKKLQIAGTDKIRVPFYIKFIGL